MRTHIASSNSVNINGHGLYVEVYGPSGAPTVVLLHHGLGSLRSWKTQISALATDYRLIIYDRWGYGKSDARSYFSMPYFAEDLEDLLVLLDKFEVEQTSLVGHSDGGSVALYFTARHPERVVNLVTVAAHIYIEPKMESGIERLRYSYENDVRFREGLRRMHGDQSDTVFYNWFNGWSKTDNRTWDMRPIIRNIIRPTLVVQGIEDEHATPQHARHIAESIPDAELWLVQGARHMLPQEETEVFNHKLLDYLGQRIGFKIQRDLV